MMTQAPSFLLPDFAKSVLGVGVLSGASNVTLGLLFLLTFLSAAVLWKLVFARRENLPECPFWRLPLVGCLPFLSATKRGMHVTFADCARNLANCADIMTVYLGTRLVIVLNDVDAIKDAFSQPIFNGKVMKLNSELAKLILVGKGIINNEGKSWREHRRFTIMSLRDFGMGKASLEGKITEEIDVLSSEMAKQNGRPFDPHHILSNSISNIICNIIFGQRFDYEDKDFKDLLLIMDEMFKNQRIMFLIQSIPLLRLFAKYLSPFRAVDSARKMMEFLGKQIEQHRATFDGENVTDFIDAYLKEMSIREDDDEAEKFDDDHLKRTIFDLFLAGSETTNTTLRWGLLYLGQDMRVQNKIRDEISTAIGDGRLPTLKDRDKMPYTEAAILEISRYASIASLGLTHISTEDAKFRGYDIPAGTFFMPNLWWVHRNPKHWTDPETFRPERFLDEDGNVIAKKDGYVPFSVGRRACLGESLAKMELFLFVTILIRNFEFSVQGKPDMTPELGLTLSSKPYKLTATPI